MMYKSKCLRSEHETHSLTFRQCGETVGDYILFENSMSPGLMLPMLMVVPPERLLGSSHQKRRSESERGMSRVYSKRERETNSSHYTHKEIQLSVMFLIIEKDVHKRIQNVDR